MQIEISRIPEDGEVLKGEELLDLGDFDDAVRVELPMVYTLRVQFAGPDLMVRGSLVQKAAFLCVRCNEWFEREVGEPDFNTLREVPEGVQYVDLTDEIREAIVCAFPSHPVCREECRGLCVQCGENRNRQTCKCSQQEGVRWEPLSGLRL